MTNKQIFESKLQSSIHYCTKKMVGKGKMWQRLFVWNVDKNFLAVNSLTSFFFPCALLYQVDRRPPWHGSHENFSPRIITTPHNLPSGKTFFDIAYELFYLYDLKNSK